MSTRSVVPFAFNSHQLRIIPTEDGLSFWAVAKDVADILGIENARDAIAGLDADEKGVATTDTPGGKQKVNTVSESGLYALIFTSRKPSAKAFRKWITAEVLPQIRRTGSYAGKPGVAPQAAKELVQGFEMLRREHAKALSHISDLSDQLKRAQGVALASDPRLARICHYANKGLNGAEVAKLTDISETTARRLMKRLRAAGLIDDLGEDGAMILSAMASGIDLFKGE